MFTVFVSHSSVDRAFVEGEIVPLLCHDDLQPWYSRDAIRAADDWEKSILAGLRASDWVAVVLSPESVASEWVKQEVDWALSERNERVIPILFRTCRPEALDARLSALQYVDFSGNTAEARSKLSALWDHFIILPRAFQPPVPGKKSIQPYFPCI